MIVFYLIGFLLISAGIVILLGITPDVVTDDMMKFISPKQTLRDKAQIAKGRKKSRRISSTNTVGTTPKDSSTPFLYCVFMSRSVCLPYTTV